MGKSKNKNKAQDICAKEFGANFTDCGTGFGLDCCYIESFGDNVRDHLHDHDGDHYKDPVACQKTHGLDFVNCETEKGWDCCVVGESPETIEDIEDYEQSVKIHKNKKPLGCAEKYGSKFQDCKRGWGWDCCFEEGVELISSSSIDMLEEQHEGPDVCAEKLGANFTDCGTGFGLDCCYVESFGENVRDHRHEMNGTADLKKHVQQSFDLLRSLVFIAVVAYACHSLVTKGCKGNNSRRRNNRKSSRKGMEQEDDNDDSIELEGLIK